MKKKLLTNEKIEQVRTDLFHELQSGDKFAEMFRTEDGIDSPGLSLLKLHKMSKALKVISRIVSSLAFFGAVGLFVISVCLALPEPFSTEFDRHIDLDIVSDVTNFLSVEMKLEPRMVKSINAFIGTLVSLSLSFFMYRASGLFENLSTEKRPFTRKVARQLHRMIVVAIPLVFWHFFIGLLVMFVLILLSAVFDYGVYLEEQHETTDHIQEDVILSFAEITEARSGQTGQHVKRVAEYTYIMARDLQYSEEMAENLKYASMMHDVGKISIPLTILEKPGKLTTEEFEIIKTHTSEGERLLHNARGEIMQLGACVANEHHEKWAGGGYPQNKSGEQISRAARIVAVADVFDALTSRRSYKDAWDTQKAYDEIVNNSGKQFDPEVVECFKRCYPQMIKIRDIYAD